MTKTTGKTPAQPRAQQQTGPARDDMQAAYEIHTLAQMMYGQIAQTNPWMAQSQPMMGPTPYLSHPQHPHVQWNPQVQWMQQTPWTPQWPVAWNPWAAWWGR